MDEYRLEVMPEGADDWVLLQKCSGPIPKVGDTINVYSDRLPHERTYFNVVDVLHHMNAFGLDSGETAAVSEIYVHLEPVDSEPLRLLCDCDETCWRAHGIDADDECGFCGLLRPTPRPKWNKTSDQCWIANVDVPRLQVVESEDPAEPRAQIPYVRKGVARLVVEKTPGTQGQFRWCVILESEIERYSDNLGGHEDFAARGCSRTAEGARQAAMAAEKHV
jgi:hypothetical protein